MRRFEQQQSVTPALRLYHLLNITPACCRTKLTNFLRLRRLPRLIDREIIPELQVVYVDMFD